MKKIILLTTLALSLSVSAKSISTQNLKKASAYLQSLSSESGDAVQLKFTNGEMNTKGDITSLELSAKGKEGERSDLGDLSVKAGLKLKKKKLNVKFLVNGNIKEQDSSGYIDAVSMMLPMFVSQINEQGDYNAKFNLETKNSVTKLVFKLSPVSEDATSIETLEVAASFNKQTADIKFSLKSTFNTNSDLVSRGQKILTTIFVKLTKNVEPSSDDMEELGEILSEITKNFNM